MHVDFRLEWFCVVLTYPLVASVDFIHYLLGDHPSLFLGVGTVAFANPSASLSSGKSLVLLSEQSTANPDKTSPSNPFSLWRLFLLSRADGVTGAVLISRHSLGFLDQWVGGTQEPLQRFGRVLSQAKLHLP